MKELSCRFEMLISPQQNKQWKAIAKSQNLTKAELIRRTMESYLQGENTEKEWQIYQKLGEISEDLQQKKIDCFNTNPVKIINEVIRSIEQLRLEVIRTNKGRV